MGNNSKRYPTLFQTSNNSINIQTYISPWIPLWWSAAFPGFGHLLLGIHTIAYMLIIFEFIVNNMAHINEAIYYSMLGDFNGAKHILDKRWFLGYIGLYVFAIYDSYRRSVEQNKLYLLSYRYTTQTSAENKINSNSRFIDITSPVLGYFWSFITPGTGAILVTRVPTFILSLVWWGITVINSHWFEGIYYTAIGDFEQAKKVLIPQWLLYVPSIILYSMYYGYHDTNKENKGFKVSQAQYLKANYQSPHFKKPI